MIIWSLSILFWIKTIAPGEGLATLDDDAKRHVTSVCHTEFFAVRCGLDEMLVILGASYGRMRINRCVRENFGYIGCSDDVTSAMDDFCSGRRSCNVRVLDDTFSDSPPCHEDLNSYLEVEFQCLKVFIPTSGDCQTNFDVNFDPSSPALQLPSPSFFPFEDQCLQQSSDHVTSWIFTSRPGQRLKITLTDFRFSSKNITRLASKSNLQCAHNYGITTDRHDGSSSIPICGSPLERQSAIFLSSSNFVKMELNHQPSDHKTGRSSPYLIRIETVGCLDDDAPMGGWMMRNEDSLVMGCNNSLTSWRLECVNRQWKGAKMNCTMLKVGRVTEHLVEDHLETFVLSLGVLFAAASFSASFICLMVLLVRKVRHLRRQQQELRRHSFDIASTICHHLSY